MVDDDDDLWAAEPGAAAVEQGEQCVSAQECLFLEQIGRAAVGCGVVEQGLDLGVEAVLQAQRRFGVPGCGPATHPGVAIDPGVQPDRPTLPLQAGLAVTVGFQAAGLGAHGAGELVRGRVLSDQHQPFCVFDEQVAL